MNKQQNSPKNIACFAKITVDVDGQFLKNERIHQTTREDNIPDHIKSEHPNRRGTRLWMWMDNS